MLLPQVASTPFQIAFMPPPATSVIVADYNNARFIEISVLTGNLIKVWLDVSSTAASGRPMGVGTSPTIVAFVDNYLRIWVYDIAGNLLRTFTPNSGGDHGVRVSFDGQSILVGNRNDGSSGNRIVISSGVSTTPCAGSDKDYVECAVTTDGYAATGVGTIAAQFYGGVVRVSAPGGVCQTGTSQNSAVFTSLGTNYFTSAYAWLGGGLLLATKDYIYLLSTPALSVSPSTASVRVGSPTTFTVSGAPAGVSYAWSVNNVPAGTNSPTFDFVATSAHMGSTVTIACTVVPYFFGTVPSATVTVTVSRIWNHAASKKVEHAGVWVRRLPCLHFDAKPPSLICDHPCPCLCSCPLP